MTNTISGKPYWFTRINPDTGEAERFDVWPAIIAPDATFTFTIQSTQEEPMTPTRREVWAEIKDRVGVWIVDQTPPFTIACASVCYEGDGSQLRCGFTRFGVTRCCHKDEWNPTTGANIAKGRAISNLLDTIMASLKGER